MSNQAFHKPSITIFLSVLVAIMLMSAIGSQAAQIVVDDGKPAVAAAVATAGLTVSTADSRDEEALDSKRENRAKNIASEGELNAATAVPVPAALWLFGTALFALFTVARRKAD